MSKRAKKDYEEMECYVAMKRAARLDAARDLVRSVADGCDGSEADERLHRMLAGILGELRVAIEMIP